MKYVYLMVAMMMVVAVPVMADTFTLTDKNSTVQIDPYSSAGIFSWQVNGREYLVQQTFGFRIGHEDPVSPISNIPVDSVDQPSDNFLSVKYMGPDEETNPLKIKTEYALTGACSNKSELGQTVSITNIDDEAVTLQFFQYSKFNLSGDCKDLLSVDGPNTTLGSSVDMTKLVENVFAPRPTVVTVTHSPEIFDQFDSGDFFVLKENHFPVFGDVEWAMQWDITLDPGETFLMSSNQILTVPEPMTMVLLLTGAALAHLRRRRSRA